MKRTAWFMVAMAGLVAATTTTWATAETDLRQAATEGRPVFLIVTQGNIRGIELARKVASEAQQMVPGSLVTELDRGDPANAGLVAAYRLVSAPVPLILVIASNGVAAGGASPSATTASKLARMVPSPAKAAMLKAVTEGKPSFLVFARAGMPSRAGALAACAGAVLNLKGLAAVVQVNVDDPREAAFGVEMQVDPKSSDAVVVVVTAKGARAAAFAGTPLAKTLSDATVAKAGGCAPGSCGPGGCK